MNFLRKIFGAKQEAKIVDNKSFWDWFIIHHEAFYKTIKNKSDVDAGFLKKLMPKLQELNNQYYCSAGMYDSNTAELIITPEGNVKTFVFAEVLVAAAPEINGWKFTALKQPIPINNMNIEMDGYLFDNNKIGFFSNRDDAHPDEIDISLVHTDYNEADRNTVINGTYIYLDNVLGELNAATLIDRVRITGAQPGQPLLIPIEKLNDFLIWREKEFVEKYKGTRHDTENDTYTILEAEDKNGFYSVGVINQDLLNWDATASHPWIMIAEVRYDGKNNNGMPGKQTQELMNEFEDELTLLLPDHEGYLNLGRETYNNARTIYFACNEFRNVSKIVSALIAKYSGRLQISYDIFKDKYWKTMSRFKQGAE